MGVLMSASPARIEVCFEIPEWYALILWCFFVIGELYMLFMPTSDLNRIKSESLKDNMHMVENLSEIK